MPEMTKDNAKRITRAKIRMLLDNPFFGTLTTKLENVEDEKIPTACTNGKEIRWNPKFLKSLTNKQLEGVLAHEVLHVANGHTWRRNSRDPMNWNIACDLAINGILTNAGFELPKEGLFPPKGQDNKSAEQHYQGLPPPPKKSKGGAGGTGQKGEKQDGDGSGEPGEETDKEKGNDPGGAGGVEDAPGGQEGAKQQEEDWKISLGQATAAAKGAGKMPADLARLVEEIINPSVPWQSVLREFVERTARNDYNWTIPNRRYIHSGIILPSLISEQLPAIVIAVDCSGSIGQKQLDEFAAEASAILGAFDTTLHVVYFDARVTNTQEINRSDFPFTLTPKGGGGTMFAPVFKHVEKEGLQPACTIFLTDGDACDVNCMKEPEYPVLWVLNSGKREFKFGTTVEMKG